MSSARSYKKHKQSIEKTQKEEKEIKGQPNTYVR
jgi:hypothetical protein